MQEDRISFDFQFSVCSEKGTNRKFMLKCEIPFSNLPLPRGVKYHKLVYQSGMKMCQLFFRECSKFGGACFEGNCGCIDYRKEIFEKHRIKEQELAFQLENERENFKRKKGFGSRG